MQNVDNYRTPQVIDRGSLEKLTKDSPVGEKPEAAETTVVWGTPPPVFESDDTDKPAI
jgi:hypothetical protein